MGGCVKILLFAVALLVFFSACGRDENSETTGALGLEAYCQEAAGFVDKRFELVSLVFRLAGNPEYSDNFTDYQRRLDDTFQTFSAHPAAVAARGLGFGFDAVFRMAVHLEWAGDRFELVDNIDFLVYGDGGLPRWTVANAPEFVELLNDFYVDTDFGAFFREHIPYFQEHSARFYDYVYSQINHEWFIQHGINPENMRAVLSPASSRNGYGATVFGGNPGDKVIYAALPGSGDYSWFRRFIVHEYVHAFANPIAYRWYAENETFRHWADSSVDLVRMPFWGVGLIMANEYVTRAYTILYMVENTDANAAHLLLQERANGFPYIEYVYAMITGHEPMGDAENMIYMILGAQLSF